MSLTSLGHRNKWTTNSLLQPNSEVLPDALLNHFQIYISLILQLREDKMSFTSTVLAYNVLAITKHQFRSLSLKWHRSENYDIAFRSLRLKAKWFIAKYDRERTSEKDRLNETEEEGKRKREGLIARETCGVKMKGNQSRVPMRGEGDLLWLIILQPTMRRNNLVNVNNAKYAPNAVSRSGDSKWQLEDDVTLSVRQT